MKTKSFLRTTDAPSLWRLSRRTFLQRTTLAAAGSAMLRPLARAQLAGDRPAPAAGVRVVNPRGRVPLSFIIDDSTCLVNMAHFGIPQFAEVFPDQYRQDWRSLPREIPDAFVRKFAAWCHDHGVKGKYSLVPYPACVGWLDRDLPGWSQRDLQQSLDVVREVILPDWDIHPEMVSHTWAIDTRTGRPYPERTERFMENWGFSVGKSVDELTDYLSYALRILHRVDMPCEGITTPGGFGNRVLPELAQATLAACRDVYQTEIPHYFRHLYTGPESVAPRVEYASGIDGPDPRCVVSIIGCTGDWFGGWDGLTFGSADRFITADLRGGRLPEVIERGEPAILVCHWPGIYCNGEEIGFDIFKTAVTRLEQRYDHLTWMKLSEIARYWAAKELTWINRTGENVILEAPFACPGFTLEIDTDVAGAQAQIRRDDSWVDLRSIKEPLALTSGGCTSIAGGLRLCFDLPRGQSRLRLRTAA